MLFNSTDFLVFFLVFVLLYYGYCQTVRMQNVLILLASLYFYAFWSIQFVFLMLVSSTADYLLGLLLGRTESSFKRRSLVAASVIINLSILFTFKYYNFFIMEFEHMLSAFGWAVHPGLLQVVLPLGISFYTFQTMGYTIDVYRKETVPERDFITYTAFVTFFPQLVAGPIEKASHLIPQIRNPRKLSLTNVRQGFWLMVWGYFLKVVVADSAAPFADYAFMEGQTNSIMTLLGTMMFGLQIYCDFFGYSLIALGLAKLIGIHLSWNFKLPYFSTSIQEFWRRWHITLGVWFRDNLYVPLGGSRCARWRTALNLMIVMTLIGLWHGANWNFILWGILHGAALLVHRLYVSYVRPEGRTWMDAAAGWLFTMVVVFVGWFLFRVQGSLSLDHIGSFFSGFQWDDRVIKTGIALLVLAFPVFLIDKINHDAKDMLYFSWMKRPIFSTTAGVMIALIVIFFQTESKAFIYFQF